MKKFLGALGYTYVTLDLQGFRSGSMLARHLFGGNEVLTTEEKKKYSAV